MLLVLAPSRCRFGTVASRCLDLPLNFANIIVIPLLIGLGVASSIHIVVRTHEVVSDSTGTHEEGMHVLDTSTPLAVLVAQLNTVAAFATLAVAEHRGLFSMGVLLGIPPFVLIVSLIVFLVRSRSRWSALDAERPERTKVNARVLVPAAAASATIWSRGYLPRARTCACSTSIRRRPEVLPSNSCEDL